MTAATFHIPSPPNEIENLSDDVWQEGDTKKMIHVCRISSRGNPHMRGLVVSSGETTPVPAEFEIIHLPEDRIDAMHQDFKDGINARNNGVEHTQKH